MPMLRILILVIACCLPAATVFAQQDAGQRPLEQAMSTEEFQAAGLNKLSAQELATLNTWLNRTISTASAKAAELAESRVQTQARGFFNFGSDDPIVTSIVGDFRGYARGRNYSLANGQEWEQIDDASLVGVRKTSPGVRITPSVMGNAWYLQIDGYNTRAKVRRIK